MKVDRRKFIHWLHEISRLAEEIRQEINRHSNTMIDLDMKIASVRFLLQEAIEDDKKK